MNDNGQYERPVGIDLFSGVGGLSLGFEQAGFDIKAAVEIDPIHAVVHKFNFPYCTVIPESVTDLSGHRIRELSGLLTTPIDVVFGGAPCQGFSLIGHRILDDPRNSLVKDFVRIVTELSASYFVFENVKGLTVGSHRMFLNELIDAFAAVGYSVRTPWQVLNASSYGVPQDRERLILLGARETLPLPDYPEPTTYAPGRPALGLSPGPTCYDALADLPEAEDFEALWDTDWVITEDWGSPSEYVRHLREGSAGDYSYPRQRDPLMLTSSTRTNHTEISRRRFAETKPGTVEPISRFFRLPADGVSNTLRAGTDSARGAFTSPRPIHYDKARCITVREMARLHGFPDWFRLHRTKWHGARQVGNAVAPPLAKAIATEIMKVLDRQAIQPEAAIALGNDQLLSMDISAASAYLNVGRPDWRRNARSVHKKRNQLDIEAERLASIQQ